MIGYYDENLLIKFKDELYNAICENDISKYKQVPDDVVRMLCLNDCNIEHNATIYDSWYIKDILCVSFIRAASANKPNMFYDCIELNGTVYFVIFLDYFKGIFSDRDPIIGKSNYFDAIVKVSNILISLTTNQTIFTQALINTSASRKARTAPYIIAGEILNMICGLTEEDVPINIGLPYIMTHIGVNTNTSLYGLL